MTFRGLLECLSYILAVLLAWLAGVVFYDLSFDNIPFRSQHKYEHSLWRHLVLSLGVCGKIITVERAVNDVPGLE